MKMRLAEVGGRRYESQEGKKLGAMRCGVDELTLTIFGADRRSYRRLFARLVQKGEA